VRVTLCCVDCTPVPVSDSLVGELVALLIKETVPDTAPAV